MSAREPRATVSALLAMAIVILTIVNQYYRDRSGANEPCIRECIDPIELPGQVGHPYDPLPLRHELRAACGPAVAFGAVRPNPLADDWVADERSPGEWCTRNGVLTCLTRSAVLWYKHPVGSNVVVKLVARSHSFFGPRVLVRATRTALHYHLAAKDTRAHDGGIWCGWGLIISPLAAMGWAPGHWRESQVFTVEPGKWHEQAVETNGRTVTYSIDGRRVLELTNAPAIVEVPVPRPPDDHDRIALIFDDSQIRSATVTQN